MKFIPVTSAAMDELYQMGRSIFLLLRLAIYRLNFSKKVELTEFQQELELGRN